MSNGKGIIIHLIVGLIKRPKITELENKIPDISNLATKTALTTIENKMLVMLVIKF